jgi:membrane protease YdiL (CAAX protease family)
VTVDAANTPETPTDVRPQPPGDRRRALRALLLIVPAPTIGVASAMLLWEGPVGQGIYMAAKVWLLLFPTFWFLAVERRRASLSPPRHGGWGAALLTGVGISAVIVLAAWLAVSLGLIDPAALRAESEDNGIGTWPAYLGLAAYATLINALIEEYVYRWFIFRQWAQIAPGRVAVVLAALCFTIHHIVALKAQFGWTATILGSLGVFIGGLVWSWMYARYRSVWPGYLSHAIVDVAVFGVGAWLIFLT